MALFVVVSAGGAMSYFLVKYTSGCNGSKSPISDISTPSITLVNVPARPAVYIRLYSDTIPLLESNDISSSVKSAPEYIAVGYASDASMPLLYLSLL